MVWGEASCRAFVAPLALIVCAALALAPMADAGKKKNDGPVKVRTKAGSVFVHNHGGNETGRFDGDIELSNLRTVTADLTLPRNLSAKEQRRYQRCLVGREVTFFYTPAPRGQSGYSPTLVGAGTSGPVVLNDGFESDVRFQASTTYVPQKAFGFYEAHVAKKTFRRKGDKVVCLPAIGKGGIVG